MVSVPNVAVEVEEPDLDEDVFLDLEDGRRQFDALVRARLGISGDEFIRRYDAGEYAEIPDDEAHRDIIELALLSGFGR